MQSIPHERPAALFFQHPTARATVFKMLNYRGRPALEKFKSIWSYHKELRLVFKTINEAFDRRNGAQGRMPY